MSLEQSVIACLNEAGFPDVVLGESAYRRPSKADLQLLEPDEDENFLVFRSFAVLLCRLGLDVYEARRRAAQCLLDAGFRNFHSEIKIVAHHSEYFPAEHTPEDMSAWLSIEFMNGIWRYTPEEIAKHLARGEQARAKHKESQERAKTKREIKSLDKALRKVGLID